MLIFPSLEKKRVAMRQKTNLKNVKVEGNKVFLSDYLPPAALDKRKREYHIIDLLKANGQEIAYKHGAVSIEGLPYKKKIQPPTPRELINVEPEEISRILSVTTTKGQEFVKHKSIFTGFSANVSTYEQIMDVYKKVKLIQPEARHIVCVYSIDSGSDVYGKDYHDDGEPGAGHAILDMMERNNITQKVVLIA